MKPIKTKKRKEFEAEMKRKAIEERRLQQKKRRTDTFSWLVVCFFALCIPTLGSIPCGVIAFLIAVLALPIPYIRNLWKKLPFHSNRIKPVVLTILFLIMVGIYGNAHPEEESQPRDSEVASSDVQDTKEDVTDEAPAAVNPDQTTPTTSVDPAQAELKPQVVTPTVTEPTSGETAPKAETIPTLSDITAPVIDLKDIPAYLGTPYAEINQNVPYFADSDLYTTSFELYSNLDSKKRCGVTFACIGKDLMPTEDRESIGSVKPTGWHTVKYAGVVDGNYLYNRCHLIGFQLTGENANETNLITGTRYLNVDGMLPFENMVADYIKETNNHVMYRVTPVFDGNNLLANGVLMEAKSVEDNGDGILFCVFCYNVQPGVILNYSDGSSKLEEVVVEPKPEPTPAPAPVAEEKVTETPSTQPEQSVGQFVVNGKNGKIHMYGECAATGDGDNAMTNPVYFSTYEEALAYSKIIAPKLEKRDCGNCW